MILNTGWIPGYLQRTGEMLREYYKNKRNRQTYQAHQRAVNT